MLPSSSHAFAVPVCGGGSSATELALPTRGMAYGRARRDSLGGFAHYLGREAFFVDTERIQVLLRVLFT
jgi:hypothetical protein